MHFTREFASIVMHSRNEGLAAGLYDTVINKGAGVLGPLMDFFTGTDKFGKEIADPNSNAFKQLVQRTSYMLSEFEPITMQAIRDPRNAERPLWQPLLGFSRAPKYAEETKAEGHIRIAYNKYVKAQTEPYDRVVQGQDYDRLRMAYARKDPDFYQQYREMVQNYKLEGRAQQKLLDNITSNAPASYHMFQQVGEHAGWNEQKALFQQMTLEEKRKYFPFIKKGHEYEAARAIIEETAEESQ
jgi:hypothetical protein